MTCDRHDKEFVWIELSPGKRVKRCPDCHAGVKVEEQNVHAFPKIKYAQNFFRDRPWNDMEKSTPFGKPKKAQW